jgi:hypothetical protein
VLENTSICSTTALHEVSAHVPAALARISCLK